MKQCGASLNSTLKNITNSLPEFDKVIAQKWICNGCDKKSYLTSNYIINLDFQTEAKNIENLLSIKETNDQKNHSCDENNTLRFAITHEAQVCIFESSTGMDLNLDKQIEFGGHSWICSSAVTGTTCFFKENDAWYFTENQTL